MSKQTKSVGNQAKEFAFTLNNYNDDDIARLMSLENDVEYLVFGKEVGESGTPHLQGHVVFAKKRSWNKVRLMIGGPLGRAMVSVARKPAYSEEYCRKDGDYTEIGIRPIRNQGKRTDIDSFKDFVKENPTASRKTLREEHSEVWAKYPRFCIEYTVDNRPAPDMEMFPLRVWQAGLNEILNRPASNREVIFVVDVVGNTGKSWFCHYYASLHENVQVMLPAKKMDMAYMLDETSRVIFIDAPRSKTEYLQYDFFEECKNGYVLCGKYESVMKTFRTSPHLVVMMNQRPDEDKLSADRYHIITITPESNRTAAE
jgi:hypothetical protein